MYNYQKIHVHMRDTVEVKDIDTENHLYITLPIEVVTADVDSRIATVNEIVLALPDDVWSQIITKVQEGLNSRGHEA